MAETRINGEGAQADPDSIPAEAAWTNSLRRRIKIQVTLLDGVHGDELGRADTVVELRTDLLTAYDPGGAQDWYSSMIAALGTMAYREAFPRSGRGETRREQMLKEVLECRDCPHGAFASGSVTPPYSRCVKHRGWA